MTSAKSPASEIAALCLGGHRDPRAASVLVELLARADATLVGQVTHALRQIPRSAARLLYDSLPALDDERRIEAARIMSQARDNSLLREGLRSPEWSVRHACVIAARDLVGEDITRDLWNLANEDSEHRVRRAAISAWVAQRGTHESSSSVVKTLIGFITDPDSQVKLPAADALAALWFPEARKAILKLLQSKSVQTRIVMLRALTDSYFDFESDRAILAVLDRLTRDKHPLVRRGAARALVGPSMDAVVPGRADYSEELHYGGGPGPGPDAPGPEAGAVGYAAAGPGPAAPAPDSGAPVMPAPPIAPEPVEPHSIPRSRGPLTRRRLRRQCHLPRAQPEFEFTDVRPRARFADVNLFRGGHKPDHRLRAVEPLQLNTRYEMEVAIRQKRVGVPLQENAESKPVRSTPDVATILVCIESSCFSIDPQLQKIHLRPNDDSTSAWFTITPVAQSTAALNLMDLHIRLYYQFNLLEHLTLMAEVNAGAGAGKSLFGRDTPVFLVQEDFEERYEDLARFDPRNMNIAIRRGDLGYSLSFVWQDFQSREISINGTIDLTDAALEDLLIRAREILEAISLSGLYTPSGPVDTREHAKMLRQMARFGRELWNMLFKGALKAVGELLLDAPLPNDALVQIRMDKGSSGFLFPWALLYDRKLPENEMEAPDADGFWGYRYTVEQLLPFSPPFDDARLPIDEQLRVAFVLWEHFPNAGAEVAMMQNFEKRSSGLLQVGEPLKQKTAFYRLLQSGTGSRLFYFYTHGYTRPRSAAVRARTDLDLDAFVSYYEALEDGSPHREGSRLLYESIKARKFEVDRSWIELTNGKLYLDELWDTMPDLSTVPVVILNMCESAQITPALSESFVEFFLQHGTRSIIGTECMVTTDFAHPFASEMLDRFLAGQPVGKALLGARRLFKARSNPLGLAYTLYGSATAAFDPPCFSLAAAAESRGS